MARDTITTITTDDEGIHMSVRLLPKEPRKVSEAQVLCDLCELPNGEAVQPCFHCRLVPRAKDVSRQAARTAKPVAESKGEGEERSFWRFFGRVKRPSRVKV